MLDAGRQQPRRPAGAGGGRQAVLVAAGERIRCDGRVADGVSELDTGLISGESVPGASRPGDKVFAGTVNLGGAAAPAT